MNDSQLKKISEQHLKKIRETAEDLGREITLMEICGGHTNLIMKYGIRGILPKNIRLISGPGCPVCVSAQRDIDCMIEIALQGIPVATYGDMLRVPGSSHSLDEARAKGGKVFEVYSTTEVLELKKKNPDIVFFGVGFETTAPMTAFLLEKDVCVYSVHKLVPPAMEALISGEVKIDGFIDPGHVSTIIGIEPYRKIKVAQVVSGFTVEQVLRSISLLVELIRDKKSIVINGYPEAVHEGGNSKAQKILVKNFCVADSEWRGLGMIPSSGLEVKDDSLNAKIKYKSIIEKVPAPKKTVCRCGEILKGTITPEQCPLYAKVCTPENPLGACMVSEEGTCSISYQYRT
jgi:hydrogenase expression/formation protein HypD